MILYTMMPQELVFQPDQEVFGKQKLLTIQSIPVIAEEAQPGEYRIVRILSSNPYAYLNSALMPGATISANPASTQH